MNIFKIAVIACSVLTLFGCAQIEDRKGSYVDIYPVDYRLSLHLEDATNAQSKRELDSFIEQYWSLITTQPVSLVATSKKGLQFAASTRRYLLTHGVEADHISMHKDIGVSNYDFEMSVVQNKVVMPSCVYHAVGHYDQGDDGCYSENARWSSFVRPERMFAAEADVDVKINE
jgi:hypothetical protein